MRKGANQDLTDEEGAFVDQHEVGAYTRNINSGFHELDIMVNGLNGKIVKVTY